MVIIDGRRKWNDNKAIQLYRLIKGEIDMSVMLQKIF